MSYRDLQTEKDISGLREKLNQIIDSHNLISEEIEQLTSEVGGGEECHA